MYPGGQVFKAGHNWEAAPEYDPTNLDDMPVRAKKAALDINGFKWKVRGLTIGGGLSRIVNLTPLYNV